MSVYTADAVTIADIEAARERIGADIRTTPIITKDVLTRRVGVPVALKAEHMQHTGSFKIRGALNLLSQLDPDVRARGVVAASAGNHAQGVAVAAARHDARATIFMPEDATLSKVEATRGYGADVRLEGAQLSETIEAARAWAADSGATFVHPFDDPRIIAGQGTLGLELLEQVPDMQTLVMPIGGGGLFCGVAAAVHAVRPEVRIIGVQSSACPSVASALAAGHPVPVTPSPTMADGIAVKQPGALTFPMIQQHADEVVLVDDNELSAAMLWLIERAKQIQEGAGAASLAALMSGKITPQGSTVCVLSGGNIDPIALIPIIRHGLTTVGRFVRIETTVHDRPGELSRLLALLAKLRVNILAVEHRREGVNVAVGDTRIEMTLQTRNKEHVDHVRAELLTAGYEVHAIE